MTADLSHLTLNEADGKADCSVCHIGITVPPSFGFVTRNDMLAAFIVQHSVHTKAGAPAGLTDGGKPTKRARDYLGRN